MLTRHFPCIALCLCFFLVGIVIGGCLIALLPHPNHIHLTILPNHKVNVSPEVGDVIDWVGYHQEIAPTITFSPFIGIPCDKGRANPCRFIDTRTGIFPYGCSGSANCDPGVGPKTGTGFFGQGAFSSLLSRLARILEIVVLEIDRTFGLLPTPTETSASEATAAPSVQSEATSAPSVPAVLRAADDHDGEVTCSGLVTQVTPNINKTKGGTIVWNGSVDFTLAIDQSKCQGDTSKAGPYQECKLVGGTAGVAFTYTANANSCTTQPKATATITPQ